MGSSQKRSAGAAGEIGPEQACHGLDRILDEIESDSLSSLSPRYIRKVFSAAKLWIRRGYRKPPHQEPNQ